MNLALEFDAFDELVSGTNEQMDNANPRVTSRLKIVTANLIEVTFTFATTEEADIHRSIIANTIKDMVKERGQKIQQIKFFPNNSQ